MITNTMADKEWAEVHSFILTFGQNALRKDARGALGKLTAKAAAHRRRKSDKQTYDEVTFGQNALRKDARGALGKLAAKAAEETA